MCLVAQSCLALHRLQPARDFPGKNTGVLPFPPPGDLPHAGIEPMSPVLQTDSLRTEALGKPLDVLHLPKLLEVV